MRATICAAPPCPSTEGPHRRITKPQCNGAAKEFIDKNQNA
jgi:hypothetical protein